MNKICVNISKNKGELFCTSCTLNFKTFVVYGKFKEGKYEHIEKPIDVFFCPYCGAKVLKRDEIRSISTLLKYGRNKSLRDTAAEMRISYPELNLIENGKVKPKKETIKKICDYFKVDYMDYL